MKTGTIYSGFLILILMSTSCGRPSSVETETATPPQIKMSNTVVEVEIKNMQFSPEKIEVKIGDTVEWRNNDLTPHTVNSPILGDSGSIASEESWQHTFTETGDFAYICSFHPTMKGIVIVK